VSYVNRGMDEERMLVESFSSEVIALLSGKDFSCLPLIEIPMTFNSDEFLFPEKDGEVLMIPYPRDCMLVSYIHFLTERGKEREEGLSPLFLLERFMEDREQIDGENFCLYLKKAEGGSPLSAGLKASLYYTPREMLNGMLYWIRGTIHPLHEDDLYARFAQVLFDLLSNEWKETCERNEGRPQALRFHVEETQLVPK